MTLSEFVNARLDEDHAAAKAAFGPGIALNWPELPAAVDAFVDRYGPLRVVREVTAKRAILAEHEDTRHGPVYDHPDGLICIRCAESDRDGELFAERPWPCQTVRAVGAVYSDHPDYDEAWKPWKGPWPGG